MNESVKVDAEVNIYDEWFDERPDKAIIEITRPLAKRILEFASTVKKLNAYKICEFDYTPVFVSENDDGEFIETEDFRADGQTLDVDSDYFRWAGSIKHTNIGWETESFPIRIVKELETVWKTKSSRLPLLVGTLKTETAQELLKERMKQL